MRFEDLFADLSDQLRGEEWQDMRAEAGELTRTELAGRTLSEDVAGQIVKVHVAGHALTGWVRGICESWICLAHRDGLWMLPQGACDWIEAPPGQHHPSQSRQCDRIGSPWRTALRAVARDQQLVRLLLAEGTMCGGRIRNVGQDYLRFQTEAGDSATTGLMWVPLWTLRGVLVKEN